jgi:hypothetical protein
MDADSALSRLDRQLRVELEEAARRRAAEQEAAADSAEELTPTALESETPPPSPAEADEDRERETYDDLAPES